MAALSEAIADQARILWAAWPGATRGEADAVHRARVATRRLREALGGARAAVPGEDVAKAAREVRRVTRALGPVRELDVVLAELAATPRRVRAAREAVAFVQRRLEETRAVRRAEMIAALAPVDRAWLKQRTTAIARALDQAPAHTEWARVMTTRIARRAQKLAVAVDRCGTIYVPDRLHTVRLAVKKLRYTLELSNQAGVTSSLAEVERLRAVQGRFGRLHDLQIMGVHIERLAGEVGRGAFGPRLTRFAAAVERACREEHASMLPLLPELARIARQIRALRLRAPARSLHMLRAGGVARSPRRAAR